MNCFLKEASVVKVFQKYLLKTCKKSSFKATFFKEFDILYAPPRNIINNFMNCRIIRSGEANRSTYYDKRFCNPSRHTNQLYSSRRTIKLKPTNVSQCCVHILTDTPSHKITTFFRGLSSVKWRCCMLQNVANVQHIWIATVVFEVGGCFLRRQKRYFFRANCSKEISPLWP